MYFEPKITAFALVMLFGLLNTQFLIPTSLGVNTDSPVPSGLRRMIQTLQSKDDRADRLSFSNILGADTLR